MKGKPMWCNFFYKKIRRSVYLPTLFSLLLLGIANSAGAQSWHEQLPQAKPVGHGELRWFGLHIYRATLWSEHQPFDANAPFALELTYERSISRERFLQTSMDEIKRLSGAQATAAKLKQWEQELSRVFPDVVEGDQLIGVYLPQHGCLFYDKQKLLADITDPELAQAFFAIWLDPRSKDSSLRAHLLGSSK